MTYYIPEKYPFVQEDFLDHSICDEIVEYIDSHLDLFDAKTNDVGYWAKRVIRVRDIPDTTIKLAAVNVTTMVSAQVHRLLPESETRILVPDTLDLVRWIKGYELFPHADKENPPGGEPHPFPWRDFASIIYLNDDFDGGQIYWPFKNVEIKPKKGMLAIHPGTDEFRHGVREVPRGNRYTIASFWTFDHSRMVKL